MIKNEVTSFEEKTIKRSEEPGVITTVSGKAEWTKRATVCDKVHSSVGVPLVELSKEPRISDVPSQENPGQASGDCISQVSRHQETGRIRFQNGFNFSEKASLW